MSELRALLAGITGSLGTLLWASLLMNLFTFVFALFMTRNVANSLKEMNPETMNDPELYAYLREEFGSLLISMSTLVQSITGGTEWGPVSEALFKVSALSGSVYLFYCAFGVCVLMNVVTSVVINKALDDALNEKTNFMIA